MVLPPRLLEDLEGDLFEYFERNVKNKGLRRARIIYVIDVIKFLRPYTIRKIEFFNLFIHWIMIGSYLKTSRRSLVRNKLFSLINIIGLAVSMSVGLLVIAAITDLNSYDKFHENVDRIYRVANASLRSSRDPMSERQPWPLLLGLGCAMWRRLRLPPRDASRWRRGRRRWW